jgi:hypothetical protein
VSTEDGSDIAAGRDGVSGNALRASGDGTGDSEIARSRASRNLNGISSNRELGRAGHITRGSNSGSLV